MSENARHICDKYIYKIYNWLHLPGIFIHFECNSSECANVIETLYNQIYE